MLVLPPTVQPQQAQPEKPWKGFGLADQLSHRNPQFSLLQNRYDLFGRKSLLLHGKTSSSLPEFCRKLTLGVN
jgi:hypothetical protein